jgi:hypothetical protein
VIRRVSCEETAAKRVMEEKTEGEDAYSWDANARKKIPRTR